MYFHAVIYIAESIFMIAFSNKLLLRRTFPTWRSCRYWLFSLIPDRYVFPVGCCMDKGETDCSLRYTTFPLVQHDIVSSPGKHAGWWTAGSAPQFPWSSSSQRQPPKRTRKSQCKFTLWPVGGTDSCLCQSNKWWLDNIACILVPKSVVNH